MKQLTLSGLKRILSVGHLWSKFRYVCGRFPVTAFLIGLLSLFYIADTWDGGWCDRIHLATVNSLILGIILSLAISLWCAFLQVKRLYLWQMVCVLVMILNFTYLQSVRFGLEDGVGYASVYAALAVAVVFVPVVRQSTVKLRWNYSVSVLTAMATALLVGVVMALFSTAVYGTLRMLFAVSSDRIYFSMIILLATTLPAFVALGLIPSTENIDKEQTGLGISVFVKNILLPAALIYILILYVYAIKILVTFRLPNGNVCWMVIGVVTACILIVYGLQGYLCDKTDGETSGRVALASIRVLPGLLLPLLVLMSVAIFYRIDEYGITARRLYVATFNIWAYFIVVYLLFAKRSRLNLVASSFALIFLLTSAVPHFNYCTFGLRAVQDKLKERLVDAGAEKFPLNYDELVNILNTQPREVAEDIATDIDYLEGWSIRSELGGIVACDHRIYRWDLMNDYTGYPTARFSVNFTDDLPVQIPATYTSVEYMRILEDDDFRSDNGRHRLGLKDGFEINVPVDSLVAIGDKGIDRPVYTTTDDPDVVFAITGYNISGNRDKNLYNELCIRGYLFNK